LGARNRHVRNTDSITVAFANSIAESVCVAISVAIAFAVSFAVTDARAFITEI
jgi:hypothetical protein